jgi:hypothetical protein
MIPSHMLSPALFVSFSRRTPITDMAEPHVLCVLLAGQHVSMNLLHHSPLVSCLSQRAACLEPPQTSAPVNFRKNDLFRDGTPSEMASKRMARLPAMRCRAHTSATSGCEAPKVPFDLSRVAWLSTELSTLQTAHTGLIRFDISALGGN